MPLPVIVFGAIKTLAAAATWTTGEVVLVGTTSAGLTGGTVTGIVYRNEIKDYFRYLFGYPTENEVRPLPAVIQKIENTQVNLQQNVKNQKNVVELNKEQSEILRDNQVISEGLNSRLKEASILIGTQEIEFKNIVDQVTPLLGTSSVSITDLKKIMEDFRNKSGLDSLNDKTLTLIDTLLLKIQSLENELSNSLDKNQFFEELMKDFEANKNQCSQIKIGKQSMFPSNHINEFSQSAINNPSLSR